MQNMQATRICKFWWYHYPILLAMICTGKMIIIVCKKICKAWEICTICKICKRHLQSSYAPAESHCSALRRLKQPHQTRAAHGYIANEYLIYLRRVRAADYIHLPLWRQLLLTEPRLWMQYSRSERMGNDTMRGPCSTDWFATKKIVDSWASLAGVSSGSAYLAGDLNPRGT